MRASARPQNASNLSENLRSIRNGLEQMSAHDEIELPVRKRHCERIARLEADALAEPRTSRPRALEMLLLEVDPDERRLGIFRSQPLGDLGGAAADIEHRSASDRMSIEDRLFLRPDRLRLRGEIPHHRLIGHFLGLRAARMRMLHAAPL
jgi:hypothetical protein